MCGATLLLTRAPWAQTGRGAAEFKDEMRRGAPKFGLFINSVSPAVAQRLAAGYSWVAVDLQHGPVAELPALLRAIKAGGARAMVRVGDQRAGLQEALDLGADGVVVPCRNATEVRQLLTQCHSELDDHGRVRAEARRGPNNLMVTVQVETKEAVEAPRPAGAPARRATRTENERADRC